MNLNFYVYFIRRFVIGGSIEFLSIFQNGYSFSRYPKFSAKLTFFTPWYAYVRVPIEEVKVGVVGLEMLAFRNILRMYLWMISSVVSSTILQQNFWQSISYKSEIFCQWDKVAYMFKNI